MTISKKITLFLTLINGFIFSQSVLANSAQDYEMLNYKEALIKSNNEWHTGKMDVQVFSDRIKANFPDNSHAIISTKNDHLLSIAPYIHQTHPCYFHIPTGCTGEIKSKKIQIKIVDIKTKKIVKFGVVETGKNGFIDLWMPKGNIFEVSLYYQGKSVTQTISTTDGAKTCITSMKLK